MNEIRFTTKVQQRIDTSENWKKANSILRLGEIGIESDTRRLKFGDGKTPWNSLEYGIIVQFIDLVVNYKDPNPTYICTLPTGFLLTEVKVEITEAFDPTVELSIGTDKNPSMLVGPDDIDITDLNAIYKYHYTSKISNSTDIKVFMKGPRRSGNIKISIR